MQLPEEFFDLDSVCVVDVETDAIEGYTQIHCIVLRDEKGNVYEFEQPTKRISQRVAFKDCLSRYRTVVGHHIIGFDVGPLRDLLPGALLDTHHLLDTLVISRLVNYNRPNGHSLKAWGEFFGVKKAHAEMEDFSVYTPEMLERCVSDTDINMKLYQHFKRFLVDPDWQPSIQIEHNVAWIARRMSLHGLPFDKEGAQRLYSELADKLAPIDQALQEAFPPRPKLIREVTPRLTQKGTFNAQDFRWARNREFDYDPDTRSVVLGAVVADRTPDISAFDGSPFSIYELDPFNPGSPRQIVERLNEAGWKPTEKTKGHNDHLKARRGWPKSDMKAYDEKLEAYKATGWKVSEENLKTLPDSAPKAAHLLAQRLTLASRLSDLDEWLALVSIDGRIHGSYTGIGAWTQRMAHARPNTANIPVAKRSPKDTLFQSFVNDVNDRMRELFIAPKGYRLIGTDADGIQMRIFAHLVGDQKLIDALVNGDKSNATDIHSVHQRALGDVCKSRDAAKTFIYAFLLGAGVAKVAEILECSQSEAKAAVDNFLNFYPGLKFLKEKVIPNDAARGYFIGLDGRKVICDSEHLMLSGYLQNGEKIIMSYASLLWEKRLQELGIDYNLINWVHDEWQTLIPDNDDLAKQVSDIQIQSIRDCGPLLNMKCPLEGTTSSHDGFIGGYTWKETH